jgi:hypothetical protein
MAVYASVLTAHPAHQRIDVNTAKDLDQIFRSVFVHALATTAENAHQIALNKV